MSTYRRRHKENSAKRVRRISGYQRRQKPKVAARLRDWRMWGQRTKEAQKCPSD